MDAIILVFSLENEASFQEVYQFFSQLNTHRSTADIPLIVVGTQGRGRRQAKHHKQLYFLSRNTEDNPKCSAHALRFIFYWLKILDSRVGLICSEVSTILDSM